MISVDCLHISLNRTLLLSVGLWPYQQSKLVQLQIILLITILTTCIIFQFTTFLTSKCTPDLCINVFSSALFFLVFLIQYAWFSINIKVVKYLLDRLLNIYNDLTDKNEIRIMEEYGSYARRYTVGLIRIVTLLGTGTLLIVYLQYSCGMFRIASYRLEQALAVDTLRKNNSRKKNLIHNKLIHAVDMHREAMKFSDSSISKFKVMFAFMIAAGVISASLNFFRLFQALLFGYNAEEILLPLLSVITYISYTFIGDYVAQEVMDHNNDVFVTAYNIQWYTASLNVQKMILFLLQRSTKVFNLNIAGLIKGSLEGAASLLSTTLSYFTVLYSVRT